MDQKLKLQSYFKLISFVKTLFYSLPIEVFIFIYFTTNDEANGQKCRGCLLASVDIDKLMNVPSDLAHPGLHYIYMYMYMYIYIVYIYVYIIFTHVRTWAIYFANSIGAAVLCLFIQDLTPSILQGHFWLPNLLLYLYN